MALGLNHLALLTLNAALWCTGRGGQPAGCAMSLNEVNADLARMGRTPAGLRRPLVVLNGYHTPHNEAWWARVRLCRLTSRRASDFVAVSYVAATRMEDA